MNVTRTVPLRVGFAILINFVHSLPALPLRRQSGVSPGKGSGNQDEGGLCPPCYGGVNEPLPCRTGFPGGEAVQRPARSSWSSGGGGSDVAREWGSADWERLLADRGDQLMGT